MIRQHRSRVVVALASLCLVAAACGGSDRGDSSATTAGKTSSAPTTAAAPSSSAAAGTTAASAAPTTAAATTTTTPGVKWGDLDSPCGKGDAKGATAQGVTDTDITIGYGDDAGAAVAPGLSKETGEAIKALISWCNDQGGINGRQIKGNYYDAKLFEVKNAMTQACADKVFMLVGDAWAGDAVQEDIRIGCKLAAVPTYSVSAAFANAPAMAQAVPNPADQMPTQYAYALAKLFPDAVKKVGYIYGNFSATLETAAKAKAATPAAGFVDLNCDQITNPAGEADWKPFAENLKRCGADFVYWVGSPVPNLENFLAAAKQVGFAPKVVFGDANHYDAAFAKWNGDNGGIGDNFYARMAFVPFEEASTAPAVQQYLDMVKGFGGTPKLLGMQATSSFLLWATAVKTCGSTVTPKCVLDEIAKVKDWTGGGMHVPTQPGLNNSPTCGMVVKLNGATWQRVDPAKGFDCDEKYVGKDLKTKYVTDAKIGADRISTQFGTFTPAG